MKFDMFAKRWFSHCQPYLPQHTTEKKT